LAAPARTCRNQYAGQDQRSSGQAQDAGPFPQQQICAKRAEQAF
jgi:hypothetical protein